MKPIVWVVVVLFCAACKQKAAGPEVNTPISGKLIIAADEAFAPLMQEEIETFESIYPDAEIDVRYLPESEVLNEFFNGTVRIAVTAHHLHDDQIAALQQSGESVRKLRLATDAVTFIVNRDNPDTALTKSEITGILSGDMATWKELNSAAPADSILVLFDDNRSGITRYLKEEILKKDLTRRAFGVESEAAMISYVEENPHALGVLSVSWVSEIDDSISQDIYGRVKVVALASADTGSYYLPLRKNLLQGHYPFIRDVNLLIRESAIGLGTGFATFLLSEEGQLIIHHFGMVAARQPVRVIEIKNEF